jgi:hypothetical protein
MQKFRIKREKRNEKLPKIAEMPWRNELALEHHRAFCTENGRKMALYPRRNETKMALLKRKTGQAQAILHSAACISRACLGLVAVLTKLRRRAI